MIIDYPELWIVRRSNTSDLSAYENWRTGLPQLFLARTIRLLGICRMYRETSSYNPSSSGGKITNRSARFHTKQDFREAISGSPPPSDEVYGKQKCWDRKITEQTFSMLLANCIFKIDKARILASKAAHTGDWLNAPPTTSIGFAYV